MSNMGYAADWPAPAGVRTWQTTRAGGVSSGTYASLNLALHVGDALEDVAANRVLLQSAIGLTTEPCWLEQIHGQRILNLDNDETGPADGAVTSKIGQVLVVMTADCLPVLMVARDSQQIGVVHAGWRGLAGGVIAAAVAAFRCEPTELLVWLGPAIGPDAFEVGDEVREAFLGADPDSAHFFTSNASGRWQADLYGLARRALSRAGVCEVYGQTACTWSDSARFFSHRREAPCGRMASLIWRQG